MTAIPDYLTYHKPEYREQLRNYVSQKMHKDVAKWLVASLEQIHSSSSQWVFKTVEQGSSLAIHMGKGDCGRGWVIAWFDLRHSRINLRLRNGTRIGDIWPNVRYQAPTSGPHSVVAGKINEGPDTSVLLEMLDRSDRQ